MANTRRDGFVGDGLLQRFVTQRGDEPVDALGIPNRVHYVSLAMFSFFVALIPMLFALPSGNAELRHPAVIAVCMIAMAAAPMLLLIGKRLRYEIREWIFQTILLYAIAGPFVCQIFLDEFRSAILTLYMLGPIGAAYFLPLRRAMPLIAIGAASIIYVSTRIDEPDAMLRGITVAVVAVGSSLMLSAMKRHLGGTIRANRELSERDALTGVYNIRKFDERLTDEIARSRREKSGFALIEFDLDQFKAVNDNYNHSVGDATLVATAVAIQSVLLPADLLVRRGGDEFAVIAPYTREREIAAMVALIRERIRDARLEICPDLQATASAAWVIHNHDESAESVLLRADVALHDAKAAARELATLTGNPPARTAQISGRVVELRPDLVGAATSEEDPISGVMRLAWRTAGASTLVLSIVLAYMGYNGKTSFEFSTTVQVLLAVWALVISPFAIWISTRERQPVGMAHLLSISSLLLIVMGCIAIGDAAPVAVEMFLLANMTFVALLSTRQAAIYATVGFALYGYFLYAGNYPLAHLRLTTTVVNFTCVGALLAINRHRTLDAAEEKAHLARTDPLTGLPNMRLLRDRLTYEIRRCETTGGSLAILMLDLDEFKSVNDEYSHSVGDEVLVAVADALRHASRHADMPARRGGDEFVVVLTDADEYDAAAAAERVADAIRVARLRITGDINPNASVGWVVWRTGDSVDGLIHGADRALKRVKMAARRGRRTLNELI